MADTKYTEFEIIDKTGKKLTQKVTSECVGCGYFYPDYGTDDPYHKCHFSDNEPSAWAPCNQE